MNFDKLKSEVCEANLELQKRRLVILTWGNVSGIDRKKRVVAIKPSGVPYNKLTSDKIVLVGLDDGKVIGGNLSPSSDTPTHLELYRKFPEIGGVTHTHSPFATAFAQAMKPLPCLGTTHADYFYGEVPITRKLKISEIKDNYEKNIGKVIIELFRKKRIDSSEIHAALVARHGPFAWGKSAADSVENAYVLEEIAKIAVLTFFISASPKQSVIEYPLLEKHYLRKHGKNAYYGQKSQ